jgi:hypothetical protein
MSRAAVTVSPAAVVVAAMVSMMTWWLASGRARQVRVMWQNSRCSILFHLEVPGQCRCLSAANYRFASRLAAGMMAVCIRGPG